MNVSIAAVIGVIAGLIVSSWQGFKDPPWEGFSAVKFVRSPLVGATAGVAAYWLARHSSSIQIDNLGAFMLATLAIERLAGEIYKGFLRPGFHAEYVRLFERVAMPARSGGVRHLLGGVFFALGLVLYWYLARFAAQILEAWGDGAASAVAIGLVMGTVVAAGGALKDSQFEGFKPRKFVRSPIMSVLGGFVLLRVSEDPLLIALGTIGFERVAVEFYKTFLIRQIRGIHAGRPPEHPDWFKRRWIFGVTFGAAVLACAWLLATTHLTVDQAAQLHEVVRR